MMPACAHVSEALVRIGRPARPAEVARVAGYTERHTRSALAWLVGRGYATTSAHGYVGRAVVRLPDLTPAAREALGAVRAGATTAAEVAAATGRPRGTARKALAALHDAGLVERDGVPWEWTWRAR